LESICIPASVERFCRRCFCRCVSIITLTFETNSRLTQMDDEAFSGCSSLKSICIPASVQMISSSAFVNASFSKVEIEEGNRHFSIVSDYLMDIGRVAVLGYLGHDQFVHIHCDAEIIGKHCFHCCSFIETLEFDPGSRLTRIEECALYKCSSLKSICIPASVEVIGAVCFWHCDSLKCFAFESGSFWVHCESRTEGRYRD
jgi:hypothetical protein